VLRAVWEGGPVSTSTGQKLTCVLLSGGDLAIGGSGCKATGYAGPESCKVEPSLGGGGLRNGRPDLAQMVRV